MRNKSAKNFEFTKMHGLGNDFVIIDERDGESFDYKKSAKKICERSTGIGCDQLLILEKSKSAKAFMRVFNQDGSEAEMCGNGLRCVASFIKEKDSLKEDRIFIDTLGGLKVATVHSLNDIEVDMGKPEFDPKKIPVKSLNQEIEYSLIVEGLKYTVTCLSLGNPHCVIIGDENQLKKIGEIGPDIERDSFFPKGTNVEIVNVMDSENISVRVWERGAGQTLACGTGATAAAVACRKQKLVKNYVKVHMPGGELKVRWDGKESAFLRGPATKVFEGYFNENIVM